MLKKSKNILTMIIAALALFACNENCSKEKQPELIDFITVEANTRYSVSIDEVFYAGNYNIEIIDSKNLSTDFGASTQKLSISPDKDFSGLAFIHFKNNGIEQVIPVKVKKKTKVTFQYKPKHKVENMFVMGNFNNWNRAGDRMTDEDGDGIYSTDVYLDEGVYEYQFVTDKEEFYDPNNAEKVDNGYGYFNSLKRVKSPENEKSPKLYFLPSNNNEQLEIKIEAIEKSKQIQFYGLIDNKMLADKYYQQKNGHCYVDLSSMEEMKGMHTLRFVATIDNQPGNVLTARIKDGDIQKAETQFVWNDAIIYSLMIDRFVNGNPENDKPLDNPELSPLANFKGGDFAGIDSQIQNGYFDSLGVNTLWIFPVTKTTELPYKEWPEPHRFYSGYHGYWPVESRETEPRFGTIEEFKKIVDSAHQHKIKVLLDFVSNHTHIEHSYFKNNPEWYGNVDLPNGEKNIRRWDEYRLTTWFDKFLPSFDYENSPGALHTVTGDAVWWLNNTGIDGFRHDATKHVPYKFWRELTNEIKSRVNSKRDLDVYQIGETFGSHDLIKSYVNNGMLDAQFNFNQFFVARRVFTDPTSDFYDLSSEMEKSLEVYGYNNLMGNLMDSHDQVRMMALFDGDITLSDNATEKAFQEPKIMVDNESAYKKELVYMTYLLTIPGIPVIYYGDEFGMSGAGDPDNRRMMRFGDELTGQEKIQLQKVTNLIHIRKKHSSLRRGDYKTLYVSKDVLVFMRGDNNERIVVALNKGESNQSFSVNIPKWIKSNKVGSLVSNQENAINNSVIKLDLNGFSSEIFVFE